MRTFAARALLAVTLLPVVACAVAPDGTPEATGSTQAAMNGGVTDTTHLAVAYYPSCVGTFIAPGLVLTSSSCFNRDAPPPPTFTTYDAAGQPTNHQVDPTKVSFREDLSLEPPCNSTSNAITTGRELVVEVVSPTLSPSVPIPPLASAATSPAVDAPIDLISFGGASALDTQVPFGRRDVAGTMTQSGPILILGWGGFDSIAPGDDGTAVFRNGALAGVMNCAAQERGSDVASSAAWIQAQIASYGAPSCTAPQASCESTDTGNVPVVSVSCGALATGQDLYRETGVGTWTLVQSLGASAGAPVFTDTPASGTRNYKVCSASSCVPLSVNVPKYVTIKHCPPGFSLCDGECTRGACL